MMLLFLYGYINLYKKIRSKRPRQKEKNTLKKTIINPKSKYGILKLYLHCSFPLGDLLNFLRIEEVLQLLLQIVVAEINEAGSGLIA